ncbi:MAG TPA: M23 family metallopeptidase [Gaiellaceae bacterium]|nr:M23 family metallopeptidase [Gaiellaceae bacterium]
MRIAALIIALLLHAHTHAAQQARPQVDQGPVWPAHGTITTPFVRNGPRRHPGIDIGELHSLRVVAAVPGRVELVGEPGGYEGYGNVVVVASRGYEELYAHLAAWNVKPGEEVQAGEHLGTAGCTGLCTGTHLHFEVRKNDVAVSPLLTVLRPLVAPKPELLPIPAVDRDPLQKPLV